MKKILASGFSILMVLQSALCIGQTSEKYFVSVKVFDVTGRELENLFNGEAEAGISYDVSFDGSRFTDGMYFLMLNSRNGITQTKKLLLDKY